MISFILATAAVAMGTVFFVRRMKRSENAIEDYFAGGRSLAWPVVAGSLLLTNQSTVLKHSAVQTDQLLRRQVGQQKGPRHHRPRQ
ncbi:MAG: hypothetical protein AAFR78_05405, partial [Planctomycetota bacterium]